MHTKIIGQLLNKRQMATLLQSASAVLLNQKQSHLAKRQNRCGSLPN